MGKIIWIAYFSQTGSEIVEISKTLNRWPDITVTNKRPADVRTIHPEIANRGYVELPNKPTSEDYFSVLGNIQDFNSTLITLHGWLRVLPSDVIQRFPYIYNGHPGLIDKYPQLKGKDPQQKAWDLNLQTSGCVIHKVTEGVDEGPILRSVEIPIRNLALPEVFTNLHKASITLWIKFLSRHWL